LRPWMTPQRCELVPIVASVHSSKKQETASAVLPFSTMLC